MAVDGSLNFDTKIDQSGFSKGVQSLRNGIGKLTSSMKSLAGAAASAFGISDISSFIGESRKLWEVQLEAETRLEQVMKNTTGATQEQIQATKDWASALQEVGVIGDEIQLSGLQELATYVENADSLKTMNVVLNDMLAQQYGLNATAENAVTISTMLGKVLEGQTSALSRYGYSFTEAQEQLLKYGTEEQKVATLAEVVEQSVGGMNEALARTPAGRLKQVSNSMGDIKEQFGQAFTNIGTLFLPALGRLVDLLSKAASAAVQLSEGLAEAFGIETDDTAKTAASVADTVSAQEELTEEVTETDKAQQKTLAGFDKMTKLSGSKDDDSSEKTPAVLPASGGTFALDADTSQAEKKLSGFSAKIRSVFDRLKKYIQSRFSGIFTRVWDGLVRETKELYSTVSGIFSDIRSLAQPLAEYFRGDFTALMQTAFRTAGDIVLGLYDTFNTVFRDIWEVSVFPCLSSFITDGLPVITQFTSEVISTIGTLFSEVKRIFDMLWNDAVKPVLSFISKLWEDLLSSFRKFWDKWGQPVFDKFRTAIKLTGDTFRNIWNTVLKPIFDKFMSVADDLWTKHLKPLIDNFLDLVGMLIDGGLDIYNRFILPVVNWFVDTFGPPIVNAFNNVLDTAGRAFGGIIDAGNHIIDALKSVLNFVRAVFKGDWESAWSSIKNFFKSIWDGLVDIVKVPVNAIIGLVNGMIQAIGKAVNAVIDAANKLHWDIPNWVPGIGGKSFGFNFSRINIPQIPYLAQGTVVPANYGEFLAVLGDNKREPEIVSPESTIENAVMRAMQRSGMQGGDLHIHVDVDGREIGRIAVRAVDLNNARRGRR